MQVNLEELKTLIEAGDKSAIEQHILKSLEKGDVVSAAAVNTLVKSELDSEKDKHHGTALQTWKDKNLQALIDSEVAKRNPEETPEQKRIRELEEKVASNEKEATRNALKAKALEYANEKGVPAKFVDRFLSDTEEDTTKALDEFKADLDAFAQAKVEDTLKQNSRSGAGGGSGDTGGEASLGKRLATNNNNSKAQDAQDAFFG